MRKIALLALSALMFAGTALAAPQFKKARAQQPLPLTPTMQRQLTQKAPVSEPRFKRAATTRGFLAPQRQHRSPMRVGATGSTIYGYMSYCADDSKLGLAEIQLDGTYSAPIWAPQGSLSCGYVREGKIYTLETISSWSGISGMNWHVYDIATGNDQSEALDLDYSNFLTHLAYDPASDMVYGMRYNTAGDKQELFTAPGADPRNLTVVATDLEYMPYSFGYNMLTGQLLGVDKGSTDLYEINKADGTKTVLAQLPVELKYKSGLCYSPLDNVYVWTPDYASGSSDAVAIYSIDPTTYEAKKLADYGQEESFSVLICADAKSIAAEAPGTFDAVVTADGGGELSATGVFTAPTTYYNGEAIPSDTNIAYAISVDGKDFSAGTAAPGAQFTVAIAPLTQGMHRFTIVGTIEGAEGQQTTVQAYIGNDVPLAPENVVLDENGISWDAVTAGVNNAYFVPEDVTYDVSVDGTSVATDVTATNVAYTFPAGPMASHRASVVAKFGGNTSKPGVSTPYLYGDAFDVPADFEPTADEFSLFTILDANNDGTTVTYDETNSALMYGYSSSNAGDDWAMLPPIKFTDPAAVYNIAFEAMARYGLYNETCEVYIGQAPTAEAMLDEIMPTKVVSSGEFTPLNADFTVPEAGTYYIGIHFNSPADFFGLSVRNIAVTKTEINTSAPAAPTNLTAVAAPQGELKATVSFTMPAKTIAGTDLSGELTAFLTCGTNNATVTGQPGANVSAEIATAQGDNEITVAVADAAGNEGLAASVTVFTGMDDPGVVQNLTMTASQDDMTLHMTWEAPSEVGVTGGYCPNTGLVYALCEPGMFGWSVTEEIGTDITSYDIVLPEGAELQMYQYGIAARRADGQFGTLAGAVCVAGTPWSMPFNEVISAQGYQYGPVTVLGNSTDYPAQWGMSNPNADTMDAKYNLEGCEMAYVGKTGMVADDNGNGVAAPGPGLLSLTKVSTLGTTKAAMTATIYTGGCTSVKLMANVYGSAEPILIADLSDMPEGYQNVEFLLPEQCQNQAWIEPLLYAEFEEEGEIVIMANFGIIYQYESNLQVSSIIGPKTLTPGQEALYTATIENKGKQVENLPAGTWTVRNNAGEVVFTQPTEAGADMAPGTSVDVTLNLTADLDFSSNFTVNYAIVSDDENLQDNEFSLPCKLTVEGITITDLKAAQGEDGESIELTWTEPKLGAQAESFENETPQASYTPETIADFKIVDRDGLSCYGSEGEGGFNPQFGKHSWAVYDYEAMGGQAPDGKNVILAVCPSTSASGTGIDPADDWCISPAIKGGSSVSFYAAPLTTQYGAETLEVMASSTTDDPDAFTLVQSLEIDEAVWTPYTVQLPADAKYFAFHYVSTDVFGVLIDLVEYVPAGAGDATINGYEVERDNTVIAPNAEVGGKYTDAFQYTVGQRYAYNITPLLSDGTKGGRSNTAFLTTTGLKSLTNKAGIYGGQGVINVCGFQGQNVHIYDTNGACLRSLTSGGNTVVKVPAGIYMVRAGKTSAKVIVK